MSFVGNSPGVWVTTLRGLVGKYPLVQSLLLAVTGVLAPRGMFLVAFGAALILAITARDILRSWGKSPLWALLVLAHPTVVILARTTMADVGQAAAAVAGWWALRRGHRFATVAWLAILVALKPTGAVLALGVVAGEALSSLAPLRARDAATVRRLAWGVAGGLAGLAVLVTCNVLANRARLVRLHPRVARRASSRSVTFPWCAPRTRRRCCSCRRCSFSARSPTGAGASWARSS